jgi:hypothetical protein
MFKTAAFVFIAALILFIFVSQRRISSESFYNGEVPTLELVQGDPILRDLYRQIHNLEAMTRIEISQNNNFAGGNDGSPRDRMVMENIALEIARLKGNARQQIARTRAPVQLNNPPALGYDFYNCHNGDCQARMDYNERILGIPSAPGSYHPYYNNRLYETSRVPTEDQAAQDMMMV